MGFKSTETAFTGMMAWYPARGTMLLDDNFRSLFGLRGELPTYGIPIEDFCGRLLGEDQVLTRAAAFASFESRSRFRSTYRVMDGEGRIRRLQTEGYWIPGEVRAPETMMCLIRETTPLVAPSRSERVIDLAFNLFDQSVELEYPPLMHAAQLMLMNFDDPPAAAA